MINAIKKEFYFTNTYIQRKGAHWVWLPPIMCEWCNHMIDQQNTANLT